MSSRPLRIAFAALTLSLTVSLSLWVLYASYEHRQLSHAMTLRMPSAPAEINSHEVREVLHSSRSVADPFAETDAQPQMVELEEPPVLIGIEAAPVAQNSSSAQAPPPFPSGDQIEELPELSLDTPVQSPQPMDEPLDLPELILEEPAEEKSGPEEESVEFSRLDPAGLEPEMTQRKTENPIVELLAEPLVAPKPPAWLSVQATLEAEIEELRQQLAASRSAVENWQEKARTWRQQQQAWTDEKQGLTEQLALARKANSESREQLKESRERLSESGRQVAATQKLLENSKREADKLQQQMEQLDALLEDSQAVNGELKNALKEKSRLISRLEDDARKARHQIEELRSKRRADRSTPQYETPQYYPDSSIQDVSPATGPAPALLPPLPAETYSSVEQAPAQAEPIVPRLAGRPDPPADTEPLQRSPSAPLIPAEVGRKTDFYCSRCGAYHEPVRKKGLVYDLRDWLDEWHIGRDSGCVCKPICAEPGQCSEAGACCDEKTGLIPELIGWWKHRHNKCDCGSR